MGNKTELHDFYCLLCGNKGIPIARKRSNLKESLHRKKLYCVNCKTEVNHIECRTDREVKEFKKNFAEGVYKEEALNSLVYCQGGK